MSKIVVEQTEIIKKSKLGNSFYSIRLASFSKAARIVPGQFVHVKIPNPEIFFRRAFSVYDVDGASGTIEILFKAIGRGTAFLAELHKGDRLDIIGPLGNGFSLPKKNEKIILAAGGVGMPPLYFLARTLINKNYDPRKIHFFYGGAKKSDLIELNRIKKLGIDLITSTDDGSFGIKGFVTVAINGFLEKNPDKYRLYACGPPGMMKAADNLALEKNIPGQLSLEAPMPCGIGVCLGCIMPLRKGGNTRVCREGPVYNIGEVLL
jgi:dihydroorotate dehydrogenase electron transfer subunit